MQSYLNWIDPPQRLHFYGKLHSALMKRRQFLQHSIKLVGLDVFKSITILMFPESRRLFVDIIWSESFKKMDTKFPFLYRNETSRCKNWSNNVIPLHELFPGNFLSREYCIYSLIHVIVISFFQQINSLSVLASGNWLHSRESHKTTVRKPYMMMALSSFPVLETGSKTVKELKITKHRWKLTWLSKMKHSQHANKTLNQSSLIRPLSLTFNSYWIRASTNMDRHVMTYFGPLYSES